MNYKSFGFPLISPSSETSFQTRPVIILEFDGDRVPEAMDLAGKRILLIDDAVGSGATFLETAKKLKQQRQATFVAGYAVVGSYKGFEVIREV